MHISSKTPNRSNLYNMQLARENVFEKLHRMYVLEEKVARSVMITALKIVFFQTGLEIGKITKCL